MVHFNWANGLSPQAMFARRAAFWNSFNEFYWVESWYPSVTHIKGKITRVLPRSINRHSYDSTENRHRSLKISRKVNHVNMLELPRNILFRTGCFLWMDAYAKLMLCCLADVFNCQLPAAEILCVGLRRSMVTLKVGIEKGQVYKAQD